MNFFLSDEQRAVQAAIRDLCEKEIGPRAAEYDKTRTFPHENFRQLADLGYLLMNIPEPWGGGADYVTTAIVVEELARACAATSVIFEVHNSITAEAIYRFGTEAQKQKYLPPMAAGKMIGGFALTEPTSGSDPASMRTRAVRQGDRYVINGQKSFITSGGVAGVYILMASTDPDKRGRGVTAFIVEKDMPGLSFGKPEDKVGLHASQTTAMFMHDLEVPAENRLGDEGMGLRVALVTLDGGRIGIAAQSVGIIQACLDECIPYAKQRTAFGKAIAEFQAIQFKLADMATQLEAARLLLYKAAFLHSQGVRATKEISMAKLFASEAAVQQALEAVQIFGGYGYINEYKVARLFRDARVTTLYEGTSEIQRLVIARHLLGQS